MRAVVKPICGFGLHLRCAGVLDADSGVVVWYVLVEVYIMLCLLLGCLLCVSLVGQLCGCLCGWGHPWMSFVLSLLLLCC